MPPRACCLALLVLLTVGPAQAAKPAAELDAAAKKIDQGVALLDKDHYDRAEKLLNQAARDVQNIAKAHPDNARAFFLLGRAQMYLERDKEALEAATRAVALAPNQADYRLQRARALGYLGKLAEAETELTRCVALAPKNVEYLVDLGRLQTAREKHKEALATFQKAAALAPDKADLALKVGGALMELGRVEEAVAACRKAARLDPTSATPHYNIGQIRQNQGRHKEALAGFQAARKLDPTDWQALAKCVQLHQALGQIKQRDADRAKLFALRKAGKTPSLQRAEFFCRDQFKAGGKKVMALEYFELTGARAIRYVFYVLDAKTKKIQYRVSLGSYELTTQIAREQGTIKPGQRMFHLDFYRGRSHATYGMFPSEPSYEKTRQMVSQVIQDKIEPISASGPPIAPDNDAAPKEPSAPR